MYAAKPSIVGQHKITPFGECLGLLYLELV
jgi:hypothetical protein